MKPVPHGHRCLCGRVWDTCNNPHCRVDHLTPCRTPRCTKTVELRKLTWLEDQIDALAQYEASLRQYEELSLAAATHAVRENVIARLPVEIGRLLAP